MSQIFKFQTNFVPDPTVPLIFKDRVHNWYRYGESNLYPQYITELYNKSSLNRRCIQAKSYAAFGEGLRTLDPNLEYVLGKANPYESWNDVFEKIVLDYVIYGGFAINVIWNKTGDKILDFYHVQFADIRSDDFDPATDRVEWYYYCTDWSRYKKHKPIKYKNFNPDEAIEYPSQIFYWFDYAPGNRFYPLPTYSGSATDIQLNIELSTYHLSNISNGLSPSLWINFNGGQPDSMQQAALYQEISSAFSGVQNAGKFFMTFSNSKDDAPDITPLQSVNDEYYINVLDMVRSSILTGHGISSPLLLGIRDQVGGGLGSNKDEMTIAWNQFMESVIKPMTKALLKPMDRLMFYSGYNTKLYVEPLKPYEAAQVSTATL